MEVEGLLGIEALVVDGRLELAVHFDANILETSIARLRGLSDLHLSFWHGALCSERKCCDPLRVGTAEALSQMLGEYANWSWKVADSDFSVF